MKRNPSAAFTMVEMMLVMAIIVILAALVAGVSGYAQRRGFRARAEGEIHMLMSACENYRIDNGTYPRHIPASGSSVTDLLKPTVHFLPNSTDNAVYTDASLFLYQELTGERTPNGGGVTYNAPDAGTKRYTKDMDPRILKVSRNAATKVIQVVYCFQDPFGNPYGYSTAAVAAEQSFQLALKQGTATTRPTGAALPGFNIGSFDLWSTAGSTILLPPATPVAKDLEWSKWVKNW
jgi:prepilin-type N-terminal cleavage/methylation domain-containing protein